MRRLPAAFLLILLASGCGSDDPQLRAPERLPGPQAFAEGPTFALGDSALAEPAITASDPAPAKRAEAPANPVTAPPRPADRCDPNYSPCVPIASDVDCASGHGDGPGYVSGPVKVVGTDVYGLDRDGDGTGCED